MSKPDTSRLEAVLAELETSLEEADPRLRLRKEWKAADRWKRELDPRSGLEAAGEIDDVVREAEAQRDMLALARAEVDQEQSAEDRLKRVRLAEDEELLAVVERELKVYGGLILAGFVLPPALLAFGPWLVVGAVAPLVGMLRMVRATSACSGRAWLILQDRIEQPMKLVLFAHAIAVASWLVAGAWVLFVSMAEQAT